MSSAEHLDFLRTAQKGLNDIGPPNRGGPDWKARFEHWKSRFRDGLRQRCGEDEEERFVSELHVGYVTSADNANHHAFRSSQQFVSILIQEAEAGGVAAAASKGTLGDLHPRVVEVAQRRWENGQPEDAVFRAFAALETDLRAKSGLSSIRTMKPLAEKAFSDQSPALRVYDDPAEHQGVQFLFKGAAMCIRNREGHDKSIEDSQVALEWLHFASALFRLLDAARRVGAD